MWGKENTANRAQGRAQSAFKSDLNYIESETRRILEQSAKVHGGFSETQSRVKDMRVDLNYVTEEIDSLKQNCGRVAGMIKGFKMQNEALNKEVHAKVQAEFDPKISGLNLKFEQEIEAESRALRELQRKRKEIEDTLKEEESALEARRNARFRLLENEFSLRHRTELDSFEAKLDERDVQINQYLSECRTTDSILDEEREQLSNRIEKIKEQIEQLPTSLRTKLETQHSILLQDAQEELKIKYSPEIERLTRRLQREEESLRELKAKLADLENDGSIEQKKSEFLAGAAAALRSESLANLQSVERRGEAQLAELRRQREAKQQALEAKRKQLEELSLIMLTKASRDEAVQREEFEVQKSALARRLAEARAELENVRAAHSRIDEQNIKLLRQYEKRAKLDLIEDLELRMRNQPDAQKRDLLGLFKRFERLNYDVQSLNDELDESELRKNEEQFQGLRSAAAILDREIFAARNELKEEVETFEKVKDVVPEVAQAKKEVFEAMRKVVGPALEPAKQF